VDLFSEPHVLLVLRTLLRLGAPPHDAEDLAQEVFVIAHRRAHEFDATRPPAAWLFGIAKNVLRDFRKTARHRYEVLDDTADDRDGGARHSDDVDLLRRALATLPEELLDAVVLCDLTELTVVETATVLGVAEGTLKDRLRRARRELRTEIDRRRAEVARV
jgi:RNA polymerase sigma-70 factor (ECF subfamily)